MHADPTLRHDDTPPAPTRAVSPRGLVAMAALVAAVPLAAFAASNPAFVAGAALGAVPMTARRLRG